MTSTIRPVRRSWHASGRRLHLQLQDSNHIRQAFLVAYLLATCGCYLNVGIPQERFDTDLASSKDGWQGPPILTEDVELLYVSPRAGIGVFGHVAIRLGALTYSYSPDNGYLVCEKRLYPQFMFDYVSGQGRSVYGIRLESDSGMFARLRHIFDAEAEYDTICAFNLFSDNCVTRLHNSIADAGYRLSDTTPLLPADLFRCAMNSIYAIAPVRVYAPSRRIHAIGGVRLTRRLPVARPETGRATGSLRVRRTPPMA